VQAVIEQQWKQVGIAADLVNYSSDVYWNGYNDGGPQAQGLYDIAEYSSVGSFPDPEISNNWLCSQISSAENPDGANWQGYCNPQMDELLKKQATTLDRDERIQLYYQIEKLIYDEVIYIGMWKDPDLWSVNQRLQGVKLSGATPFWNAHEWSVSQ
jgi:ABC-type transport system substrate-binding protein